MKIETYILPCFYRSYFEYRDTASLTDYEIDLIENWLEDHPELEYADVGDYLGFVWESDIGIDLGHYACEFHFYVRA